MSARVVEPIEFLKRPDGLGLGATAAAAPEINKNKKFIKPGQSRDQKQEFFTTESGKSVRTLDEKLVKRKTIAIEEGAVVVIVEGAHKDLKGTITKVTGDRVQLRLKLNDKVIELAKHKMKVDMGDGSERKRSRDANLDNPKKDKKAKKEKKEKRSRKEAPLWMLSDIRVRVIDRNMQQGKLYLRKGRVIDVIGGLQADVLLDASDGRKSMRIEIHQDQVETALCKEGGFVLVVQGAYRGKRGKLVERNKEKNRAVVQLDSDRSMVKCTLDDVAEHAPDPDDEDVEDARRDFDFE